MTARSTSTDRREFLKRAGLGCAGIVVGGSAAARGETAGAQNPVARFHEAVGVIPRSEWTGLAPRLSRLHKAGRVQRVTVHHSGNTDSETIRNAVIHELENIQAGHLNRRYGDIGYHVIIDRAGRVWEGRSLKYQGAHVLAENRGNVGIMLLGNFEEQEPVKAQIRALHLALHHLSHLFRVPADRVFGHCDLGASVCPGRKLYVHLDRIRKARA